MIKMVIEVILWPLSGQVNYQKLLQVNPRRTIGSESTSITPIRMIVIMSKVFIVLKLTILQKLNLAKNASGLRAEITKLLHGTGCSMDNKEMHQRS